MVILQYTATLYGAVGSGDPSVYYRTALDTWQRGSSCTLPHRKGQYAVGILRYIATLQGALGSGDPSIHYCTAVNSLPHCSGQWVPLPCFSSRPLKNVI